MLSASGAGLARSLWAATRARLLGSRCPALAAACASGVLGAGDWRPPPGPGPRARPLSLSAAAIVNSAPRPVQPFLRLMRLDKPIGECGRAVQGAAGVKPKAAAPSPQDSRPGRPPLAFTSL